MRKIPIALVALVTLAACETGPPEPQEPPLHWFHLTATQQQADVDHWECTREAAIAAPPSQRIYSSGGFRIGTTYIPQTIGSYDESEMRRWQLHALCMVARGWRAASSDPFVERRRAARHAQPTATAARRTTPIVLTPDQELRLQAAFDAMMRDPEAAAWVARLPPAH
jgi:hypothetical protein